MSQLQYDEDDAPVAERVLRVVAVAEAGADVVRIVAAVRVHVGVAGRYRAGVLVPARAAALIVHEDLVHRAALHEEVIGRAVHALGLERPALVLDRADRRDRLELGVRDERRGGGRVVAAGGEAEQRKQGEGRQVAAGGEASDRGSHAARYHGVPTRDQPVSPEPSPGEASPENLRRAATGPHPPGARGVAAVGIVSLGPGESAGPRGDPSRTTRR